MATPESVEYYAPQPDDSWALQALDQLRGALAADDLVQGWFQGTIRQFPVSTALAADDSGNPLPAVVSLHQPLFWHKARVTLGPPGVGRSGATLEGVLIITFPEPAAEDADKLAVLHRRTINTAEKFRAALLRYLQDPNPGPNGPLWTGMEFPAHTTAGAGQPTVRIAREVGRAYRAIIEFTLTSVQRTV